jgi:hypothetical protein
MNIIRKLFASIKTVRRSKSKRPLTSENIPGVNDANKEAEQLKECDNMPPVSRIIRKTIVPQQVSVPSLQRAEAAARDVKYMDEADRLTGEQEQHLTGLGISVNAQLTNPPQGLLRVLDIFYYNEPVN